jgi:hypothetical protein
MKTKRREYTARAKQCEERAKKSCDPEDQERNGGMATSYRFYLLDTGRALISPEGRTFPSGCQAGLPLQ